jgi:hypothetical protein
VRSGCVVVEAMQTADKHLRVLIPFPPITN